MYKCVYSLKVSKIKYMHTCAHLCVLTHSHREWEGRARMDNVEKRWLGRCIGSKSICLELVTLCCSGFLNPYVNNEDLRLTGLVRIKFSGLMLFAWYFEFLGSCMPENSHSITFHRSLGDKHFLECTSQEYKTF